jgi:hypothetical protein
MIEKTTHKTSGSGSAMQRWSMFGARGPLLNEEGAGGGGAAGNTAATTTNTTTTQASAGNTTSQPGTAPAEGSRTFTQEQVNDIVKQRLADERARRGNEGQQQTQQKPTGQANPPPPGMMSVDEVERIIERNTAFERVTAQANLTEGQRARMMQALKHERPEDVATWSRSYLEDLGLGRQSTTNPIPNGTTAAPTQPPTAAPPSAAGNRVNPITSGGLVDFWRMQAHELEQLGGQGLRQEYEKHLAVGKRLQGAPPVPKAVQRK